jgi:hypothetical protein
MILGRLATGLKKRDWGTAVLEVLIVVVGIFIGLQVDDWNQARQDRSDIAIYLNRIHDDLSTDAKFFTFLAGKARDKRKALEILKRIIGDDGPPDEDPDSIFGLLADSSVIGWEFPEVQTVTFIDLQSSGKLALIKDAELRAQLSFYYQESLHRSDRIESRITGYAAALYEIVDAGAGLVGRDSKLRGKTSSAGNEKFDPKAAFESFLIIARKDHFSRLLNAEQNYTEFLIAQLKIQLEETGKLKQIVSDVTGKADD